MNADSVRRQWFPSTRTASPVTSPSLKWIPLITRCSPRATSEDLPVRITLPGVAAHRVMGCAAVPLAWKVMAWSAQSPSAMTRTSPGLACSAARAMSAAVATRCSAAGAPFSMQSSMARQCFMRWLAVEAALACPSRHSPAPAWARAGESRAAPPDTPSRRGRKSACSCRWPAARHRQATQ